MVTSGVSRRRLPADNEVVCTLAEPGIADLTRQLGNTRTAASVELWRDRPEGAVVAIGNAPTALFHLLGLLRDTDISPAAVLGIPEWGSSAQQSPSRHWSTTTSAWLTSSSAAAGDAAPSPVAR